eukprot:1159892-Pelagomonas_calceolata.AAC.5
MPAMLKQTQGDCSESTQEGTRAQNDHKPAALEASLGGVFPVLAVRMEGTPGMLDTSFWKRMAMGLVPLTAGAGCTACCKHIY